MSRIDYGERAAEAFQACRQLPPAGLGQWRAAITRHLAPRLGMRVLDLGAGAGMWATALASWFDITVVAVEPSAAMRALSSCLAMIGGDAQALPLAAATMDGAWLSTVVHHMPDLPAAARELARVLRPGAPVLIRSTFAGRREGIGLVRYWPETAAVLDSLPTVTQVRAAFQTAGFSCTALEAVPQVNEFGMAAYDVAMAGSRADAAADDDGIVTAGGHTIGAVGAGTGAVAGGLKGGTGTVRRRDERRRNCRCPGRRHLRRLGPAPGNRRPVRCRVRPAR